MDVDVTIGSIPSNPQKMHINVAEFIHPDVFAYYKEEGDKRDFLFVKDLAHW